MPLTPLPATPSHHPLHLGHRPDVVGHVRGQDVIPDQVQAPGVVSLAQALQDVAALRVEDAPAAGKYFSK